MDATAIDIADPELYRSGGIPHDRFAELRGRAGLHWNAWPNRQGGFWAVTRRDDLVHVTRSPRVFTSEEFTTLWDGDLSDEAKRARRSLIETDGDPHTRLRRLVTPPFTARRVPEYEDATRAIAGGLLDAAIGAGDIDLVGALAAPLPIRVIVSILGIPASDGDFLVQLSNQLVEGATGVDDPGAYGNTTPLELLPFQSPAAHALFEFGRALGAERRAQPADDLVSRLISSEIDGDRLSDQEFCNFFQLLVFAGNETTRTAISNGLIALMEHPDQLELLHDHPELIPNAVEEVIRYASPVLHMRRTALVDTEVAGTAVSAGDWLVLWYASANFDEAHFDEPRRFDVARPVKPEHTAFGAHGPHHCLGAPLARLEIRVLLEEMVARRVTVESAGPPERVRSNFVNGILSLPGRLTARAD